jgi:hypothetical protein
LKLGESAPILKPIKALVLALEVLLIIDQGHIFERATNRFTEMAES